MTAGASWGARSSTGAVPGGPAATRPRRSPVRSGPAEPDPAVLAVIVAAVDQVWTGRRAVVAEEAQRPGSRTVWRFSGRWWAKPTVARRDRPWAR